MLVRSNSFVSKRALFALAASASIGLATIGCKDEAGSDDDVYDQDDASAGPAGDQAQPGADTSGTRTDAGGSGSGGSGGGGSGTPSTAPSAPARDAGASGQPSSDAALPPVDAGQPSGGDKPLFSFFMTSQAGLERLSGSAKGFGGDLRFGKGDGLSGADEICRQLAETSMPGNGKTWRAFLSVTKGPDGAPVNAIDRIGEGPWYDRQERIFAMNKAALLNTRPMGAHPVIINDFPNEDGVPNHDPGTGIIDNHNTLTGSTTMGTVDARGLAATCQDWTSSDADGGKPRCGVSWPRGPLSHWISILNEGGCAPGATPPGAEAGERGTVGALGGYGGFYCFALTP